MLEYPKFNKDETEDICHNKKIQDPYRWLEDPDCDQTKEFVEKQNNITFPFIKSCKFRDKIEEKLTKLWDFPTYSCVSLHGNYYYYFYNTGLQNQSVLYRMKSLEGPAEMFLDPNEWSDDGTVALKFTSFSRDGKFLAYGMSESGGDWTVVKFMNAETKSHLSDVLHRVKFSNAEWLNSDGVFYCGFIDQDGKTDGTETTSNLDHKLCYHQMGTLQDCDILCFDMPDSPKWLLGAEVTEDNDYLVVYVYKGTDPKVMVYTSNLQSINSQILKRLDLQPLVNDFVAKYECVVNVGSRFLFLTNKDAPMQKIVEVNIDNKDEIEWMDLIETQDSVLLNWASAANFDQLVVCYQKDVTDSICIHSMKNGAKLKDINFQLGSINGFFSRPYLSQVFLKYTSYLEPGISYYFDLSNGLDADVKILHRATVNNMDLNQFLLKQDFYLSRDGTRIPIFIMHHRNLELQGANPCRLYGYGGFDISIKPGFSISPLVMMSNLKFVCAVANIRGGGEYGEAWHNAGRLHNKQNCFNDFQDAAEYLCQQKYTCPAKLVIEGGSNGGLLVAACMNQQPDLFGAVIGHVGVLDMLRFHKFTIGHSWISDYGDPDIAEDFECIIKYSPLHNIQQRSYPACLLLSADHDDRVVPLHTMKFLAHLQEIAGPFSTKPLMARFDIKSGHGSGKPTKKRIIEICDVISFIQLVLDLKWYED